MSQSSGQSSGWSPEPSPESSGPESPGPDSPVGREPLPDLIGRLISEGKDYARAESYRARIIASFYAANIRDIMIFAVIALIMVFALLVAALVGLMLILSPHVGPLAAFAIVMGGSFLLTGVLLLLALTRVKRLMEPRP